MDLGEDNHRCVNACCDIRTSCARANDEDYSGHDRLFNGGDGDGQNCGHFVVRKALGRGNPDTVFDRRRGKHGRIHNAHAGVRTSYSGSEALFGCVLGTLRPKYPGGSRPSRPSPMTKRHIRDGVDINEGEDQ